MKIVLVLILPIFIFANSLINLPYMGVQVTHTKLDGSKIQVLVQRENPKPCIDLPLTPEIIWSESYASSNTPNECKKIFVTTKGIIQPIIFNDTIKTVGELEVLDFIKNKININPSKYALIDSRPSSWYQYFTIPSSINVPYNEMEKDELFEKEYYANLEKLGIKELSDGTFDLTNAKTIILFCNGAWCSQSNRAMNILIELGYPQEKIMWYRGGIQSWLSVNLTIVSNQ